MIDNPDDHPVLVFHLGERAYALKIQRVAQVIPVLKLTPVPQVKDIIEGVVNIHGQVVPVVSARQCLGLPRAAIEFNTPIILARAGARLLGIIVDEVYDVLPLNSHELIQPDALMPDGVERLEILEGVFYMEGRLIVVIDPGCLLDPAQVTLLDQIIERISGSPDTAQANRQQIWM